MNVSPYHSPLYQGQRGFESWHEELALRCGTFHVEPPATLGIANFRGAMTDFATQTSPLRGARIMSNCAHVHRAARDIRSDDKDFFFLVMQVQGEAIAVQRDTQTRIGRGDLVLLDVAQACDFRFEGASEQLSLIIPRSTLLSRYGERQLLINRRIAADSSMGSLISILLERLTQSTQYRDDEAEAVFESLVTLLRPEIMQPKLDSQLCMSQGLVRARAYIERHLTDETLCPEQIALAIGTSLRNLHRLFVPLETTVSRYILERRLEKSADSIGNGPDKLTSVAYAWGFRDFSHFSRVFKSRFGLSPREYRQRRAASGALTH